MEQRTGSKSGMEYVKVVYCHSAYLTYMHIGWLVGLVAKSCLTLATPQIVAYQAPLSIGFSGQEYGSGLPFPSLDDSSVQFSLSVVSDSLRPHKSQHARPPCPSPTPKIEHQ